MQLKMTPKFVVNVAIAGTIGIFFLTTVDLVSLFFGLVRKGLKLAWRLVVFSIFADIGLKLLGRLAKAGFTIMTTGGPVPAFKRFFFGTFSNVFGVLASFCEGRGILSGLGDTFAGLEDACDERIPAAPFGGGNPFGGGGGDNPFADLMSGGAGSPFAEGAENPFANPFGGDLSAGSAPRPPSTSTTFTSSSIPGVTIKVRGPGVPKEPPSPPSAVSDAEAGDAIDVDSAQNDESEE